MSGEVYQTRRSDHLDERPALLTREGEVELCQRIEEGERIVRRALRRSPLDPVELSATLRSAEEDEPDLSGASPRLLDHLVELHRDAKEQRGWVREMMATRDIEPQALEETWDRLEQGQRMAAQAKAELFEANMLLVRSLARHFSHTPRPSDDLLQEGNIGLMRAIEKFDYRRGYKFSTYATWWVRQAITRAIAEQGRIIRVPTNALEKHRRLKRASARFVVEQGREPSAKELSELTEIAPKTARRLLCTVKEPLSLETPTGEDGARELKDQLADRDGSTPLEALTSRELAERLRQMLSTLSPREEQVLRMRYGLDRRSEHTLKEVGQAFGLTRERIRQLEVRALRRLRHPCRAKHIRPFLND